MAALSQFFYILRGKLHKIEMDRAVFFGVLAKVWTIVSGPVTALLIAAKFTPELQGYYFTFGSLLVLQVFVELGLGTVIIQFASHEWSKLGLDKSGHISGDRDALSRLISLAKISSSWFLAGGLILILGLGIGGYLFFSQKHGVNIIWVSPWLVLSLFTGIAVYLVPVWSLLEGCNQVARLYSYRFWQGMFSSLSIWAAILLGAKLWTIVIGNAITLACAGIFLFCRYRNFLKDLLFSLPSGARMKWRKEILPMQWRIAVSWVSGYFSFFLYTPVLFHYHGAVVAGQFGMTWSLAFAIGTISTAWLTPKVPRFGMLIAQKKYKELDTVFWRTTKIVEGIIVLLAVSFWLLVYLLNKFQFPLAGRLLSPLPTGILLLAQVVQFASIPFAYYLRAHKREPLLFVSIIQGALVALSTLTLGRYYAALGMVVGYLLVNLIVIPSVVIIWYRCRASWHQDGHSGKADLRKGLLINEAFT